MLKRLGKLIFPTWNADYRRGAHDMSPLFIPALIANGLLSFCSGIIIETFLTPKKRFLSPTIFFFTPVFFMCLALAPGLSKIDDPGPLKTCIAYSCALLTVLFCYKDSVPRKIFFTFVGFLAAVPVELAITVPMAKYRPELHSLFANGAYYTPQGISVMYMILFAYIFVTITIVAIAKRHRHVLSNEALLYFFLIPLTQSFSMIFSLSKASINNNIGSLYIWVILGFTYVLADFAVYKAVGIISKRAQTEKENEFYAKQLELQLEHYESFSGYAEELRHMRHDFVNQMIVIKHLMSTGHYDDASQILDETYESLKRLNVIAFCDNNIINALVFNKYQLMQKSGIDFDVHLFIPAEIPESLEISDVCRILSNLLDNAIDACKSADRQVTDDGSARQVTDDSTTIQLNTVCAGGYMIFHCKNPIIHPLTRNRQGRLLTTKTESGHGHGLAIIDEISAKYSGDVRINTYDDIFDIRVSIQWPMPADPVKPKDLEN